tara:strand:+ start:619 stop:1059 length:441 start_codon:yes stop_codon:yes gene_type:complete
MDNDFNVHSIIEQLREVPKQISEKQLHLTKDNLESFILNHAGKLVLAATEAVDNIKEYVGAAPTAEDASALGDIISAASTAIETLNKILIADKKNTTMIKLKEMDIAGRQDELQTAIGAKLLLTREELMKSLIESSKIIDTDPIVT